MFKHALKLLLQSAILFAAFGLGAAQAAVEVNDADLAQLETIPGLGPVHAKAIIEERKKNGPFKDAADLASRVKGIGPKSVARLQDKGQTVAGASAKSNGQSGSKSGKKAETKKEGGDKADPEKE